MIFKEEEVANSQKLCDLKYDTAEILSLCKIIKYRNLTEFPGMEILRERIVSAEFCANLPKLLGNCAFLTFLTAGKISHH